MNRKAATWETAQPYVDSLRDLLRRLALNELPQGYDIRLAGQTDTSPKCFQPGLKFGFKQGQIVTGHYFTVYVGLVESFADEPIEARKSSSCTRYSGKRLLAWQYLVVGEKTELYVVVRNHREEPVESQRPSLLWEVIMMKAIKQMSPNMKRAYRLLVLLVVQPYGDGVFTNPDDTKQSEPAGNDPAFLRYQYRDKGSIASANVKLLSERNEQLRRLSACVVTSIQDAKPRFAFYAK